MSMAVHEGRSHNAASKSAGVAAAATKVSKKVLGGPNNKCTPAVPWQHGAAYYYAPPPVPWNWVYVPYYQGAYAPPMPWNPAVRVPPKMLQAKKREKKGGITVAAATEGNATGDGGGLAIPDKKRIAKLKQDVATTGGDVAPKKPPPAAAVLALLTSPSSSAAAALLELACAVPKTTSIECDKKEAKVVHPAPMDALKKRPASQAFADVSTEPVKKKAYRHSKKIQKLVDDKAWTRGFELLQKFHQENRHCSVPKGFVVDSVDLSDFVIMQRRAYEMLMIEKKKNAPITPERIAKLNSIGFVWSFMEPDKLWNRSFNLLRAFIDENGHSQVPKRYVAQQVDLYRWVHNQRTYFKRFLKWHKGGDALTTQTRIDKLDSIGFEWTKTGVEQNRKHCSVSEAVGM